MIPKSQSTPSLSATPKLASGISFTKTGVTVVKKSAVVLEGLNESAMREFLHSTESERRKKVEELMAANGDNSRLSLAQIVQTSGLLSTEGSLIVTTALKNAQDADASRKEKGLLLLLMLLKHVGHGLEPLLCPLFSLLLTYQADRSAGVRDSSLALLTRLMETVTPHAFPQLIYPQLRAALGEEDWRIKVGALLALKTLAPRASEQLSALLPDVIPLLTTCILDAKKQVQTAASETLVLACQAITNDDIRPLVPQLVSVIARPDEAIQTLNLLLETTFVATVDAPVLALIAPLLGKSLKNRSSAIKRKASRVIDIMCRLVQDPSDVAPFVPLLLPSLDKVIDELVDVEVCEVATAAREVLLRSMGEGFVSNASPARPVVRTSGVDAAMVQRHLTALLTPMLPAVDPSEEEETQAAAISPRIVAEYICHVLSQYIAHGTPPNPLLLSASAGDSPLSNLPAEDTWRAAVAMTRTADWRTLCAPYLAALFGSSNNGSNTAESPETLISSQLRVAALGEVPDNEEDTNTDDASLCNIEFSLAFGGKILLHNTFLRLGKGRRYGLLGKNGAGKTTLLTNIGSGNIEGLPPHLRMVYVQHDNQADDNGVSVVDELLTSPDLQGLNVTKEQAEAALTKIGFTDTMLHSPRSLLSGGWKMKLLIIKAMLSNADVLLLDEVL